MFGFLVKIPNTQLNILILEKITVVDTMITDDTSLFLQSNNVDQLFDNRKKRARTR